MPRIRITPDGSLQIIGLYRTDAGIYHCIAENKIGNPARKDFKLAVTGKIFQLAQVFWSMVTYLVFINHDPE